MANIPVVAFFVFSFLVATASSSDSSRENSESDRNSGSSLSGGSQGPAGDVVRSEGDVGWAQGPRAPARAHTEELDRRRRPGDAGSFQATESNESDGDSDSGSYSYTQSDTSGGEPSVNSPYTGEEFERIRPNRTRSNDPTTLSLFPGGHNDDEAGSSNRNRRNNNPPPRRRR